MCKDCKAVIQRILNDPSHITLKIRQVLNFLKFDKEYLSLEEDNNKEKDESNPYDYKVSFENYKKRLEKIPEIKNTPSIITAFLPPPIFETEVEFLQKEKKEKSYLSQLSSGERQELNVISSIIYHLRNIDSVTGKELIHYNHINLIFEEIELYFHPEYQRRFIKRLIEQLDKIRFEYIENLNICFVTHSPFILSDIPNCNVMFLKDGCQDKTIDTQTFAANISDILLHPFFLKNGFMGAYAQSRINSLIEFLTKRENTEWTEENAQRFINVIGENIVREQLQELYHVKFGVKNEIALLKKRLQELKKKSK
jgi:hypothetical protein